MSDVSSIVGRMPKASTGSSACTPPPCRRACPTHHVLQNTGTCARPKIPSPKTRPSSAKAPAPTARGVSKLLEAAPPQPKLLLDLLDTLRVAVALPTETWVIQ